MRFPFYRFDHALRCRLQDYQDIKTKKWTKCDLIQEILIHTSVLTVATYSAYEGWGAALLYAASKKNILKVLGPYMSSCTVSINSFQAADIYLEEIEHFRRDISDNERTLLAVKTIKQRLKKAGSSALCIILAASSAIPLGYIMYKDSDSPLLTTLTFLTNAPISYRGVYNLRAHVPVNFLSSTQKKLLIQSQQVFARHLMQSYDNLLQKPHDVIVEKLESLHDIDLYARRDVITPFLNLDVNEFMAAVPIHSRLRFLMTVMSVIFVVCPQFGYMLDAWKAGAVIDDKNNGLSILFLILNVLVYVGLSLDAALELSAVFFNGRKALFSHLNKPLMLISSTVMLFVSLGSGAMLADTNLSNELDDYSDGSTPIVHFPDGLAHTFEISSFISEGFTNYYYAIHYVLLMCHLYYRSCSQDRLKQGLVKLHDTVSYMAHLVSNMNIAQYKRVITHESFPQQRLRSVFSSVFTPKQVDCIFSISEADFSEDSLLLN